MFSRPIRVCTDCAGLEVPIYVLHKLNIPYSLVCSSEIDLKCRLFGRANFPAERYDGDIMVRNHDGLPDFDFYVAGFPCQTFSVMGSKRKFNSIAGQVAFGVIETVKAKKPRCFILENVEGLADPDDWDVSCLDIIVKELERIAEYKIHVDKLNTKDHGVPHNRSRVYIIGMNREGLDATVRKRIDEFQFPAAIAERHQLVLSQILEPRFESPAKVADLCPYMHNNVINKEFDIRQLGGNPAKQTYTINAVLSKSRCNVMKETCPCLLNRHPKQVWVTTHNRFIGIAEETRLQAMCPRDLILPALISAADFSKMLGNAMSANVMERLMTRVFYAVGLVASPLEDRWESGAAQEDLVQSVNLPFRPFL